MSTGRTVFILATGQDTAGTGMRIKRGFDRLMPDWTVRSMHTSETYLRYPSDLTWSKEQARHLFGQADVVHLRNVLTAHAMFDANAGKPTVLHHHGTAFRTRHGAVARQARRLGAVQVASTIDLTLLEPDVEWLPSPFNLDELAAYRPAQRADGPIRIAHAPTDRRVKSTALFVEAVNAIAERHEIEVDVIEGAPWDECLARKAAADIYYDQLTLGYGCNAIEAWAMGIPVVVGVEDPAVRAAMLERFGELPFAEATPDTLEAVLERLVTSAEARAEYGAGGRAHVERFHDERVVIPRLAEIYAAAPATRPAWRRTGRGLALARSAA